MDDTAHKLIPAHIPKHLIQDFDFAEDLHPGDFYLNLAKLHQGPDIFYTPRRGGHWVLTRYEDMEYVLKHPEDFSSEEMLIPAAEKPLRLIPIETNPPLHGDYRALIHPFFLPKAIGDLEGKARELTLSLIEDFYAKGKCEFVSEFALKMPIGIFMRLVDLPASDAPLLIRIVNDYLHAATPQEMGAAFGELVQYLGARIAERKANPGDDVLSALVKGKVEGGRSLTDEELLGFATLLLMAGLETVASSLSMLAIYLARHDDHRHQLAAQPELISSAVEELLRRRGLVMFPRMVRHDLSYKGIDMKAGELMLLPVSLAGLDERRFPDPFTVDFARKNKKHLSFGAGPHTCIGSFLGRIELRVFVTEWLKRIPDFRIKPGTEPERQKGGQNDATLSLYLEWKPQA